MIITIDAHDDDDAPAWCLAQPPKHVCQSFQGTREPHPHLVAMSFKQHFNQFDCIRLTSDKFFDGLLILDPTFYNGHLEQIKV